MRPTVAELRAAVSAAEQAAAKARIELAEAKKERPEEFVGLGFIPQIAPLSHTQLCVTARREARWLAEKCVEAGPGAVADCGEAHIVVILEELCKRVEAPRILRARERVQNALSRVLPPVLAS
jgi:hypothetical protein